MFYSKITTQQFNYQNIICNVCNNILKLKYKIIKKKRNLVRYNLVLEPGPGLELGAELELGPGLEPGPGLELEPGTGRETQKRRLRSLLGNLKVCPGSKGVRILREKNVSSRWLLSFLTRSTFLHFWALSLCVR